MIMKEIKVSEIKENLADMIGKRWMLISAGNSEKFNTMTASWGFMGYYSNRYCAVVLIRPERYTYEFIETAETFILSFFPERYRKALTLLGTQSGRDGDKVARAGLTPRFTAGGDPAFEEADLVIECRKIYASMLEADSFVDKSILDQWYNGSHGGLHKMYIAEITKVWIAE